MVHQQRFNFNDRLRVHQFFRRGDIWGGSGVVILVRRIFSNCCFLCRFLGSSCELVPLWIDASAVFLLEVLFALVCFGICGAGRDGFILYRLKRVARVLTVPEDKASDTGRLPDFSDGDPMATRKVIMDEYSVMVYFFNYEKVMRRGTLHYNET